MKTVVYILLAIILFSSCKHSSFLTRKYTQGRFIDSKRTVKHNTVLVDSTKQYASINKEQIDDRAFSLETEKQIIHQKINSIFSKKDTIIHIKKRGPDKEIVIKNNLPDVHIFIDDIPKAGSQEYKNLVKNNSLSYIKIKTILSFIFCFIPVLGFITALTCKKSIKRYEKAYNEKLDKQANMCGTALALSILPSLVAVLIVIAFLFLIFMLVFGGGAIVVI